MPVSGIKSGCFMAHVNRFPIYIEILGRGIIVQT